MGLFSCTPATATYTLRALSRLLDYPDPALRAQLPQIREVLHAEQALSSGRLAELDALLQHLARQDALDAEADYVSLFDSGRATALHLFEHVHGDSRDRGPAMIDLAQTYEKAGLYLDEGTMPDHLPVVLEYASTQPPRQTEAFLGEFAHLLNIIFNALERRGSRYASVLGALLDLAGEPARPVTLAEEESFDQTWSEPQAFDGCRSAVQGSGGHKPVHVVRRHDATRAGAEQ